MAVSGWELGKAPTAAYYPLWGWGIPPTKVKVHNESDNNNILVPDDLVFQTASSWESSSQCLLCHHRVQGAAVTPGDSRGQNQLEQSAPSESQLRWSHDNHMIIMCTNSPSTVRESLTSDSTRLSFLITK